MTELPGGTVTLLFTDIELSTKTLRELGSRYPELLELHRKILTEAVTSSSGQQVETQGDACLAVFRRCRDAVEAAVAAQRALAAAEWPGKVTLRVRMGIHSTEPFLAGGEYVGLGVHRGARICAAGHGGQVLLSATACGLVEDDLPSATSVRDLGEVALKDFPRAEHLYQLVIQGLQDTFPPLRAQYADDRPIPFEDEHEDLSRRLTHTIARLPSPPPQRVEALPPPPMPRIQLRPAAGGAAPVVVTGRLRVGREADNNLVIADDRVSRHHAVVTVGDDGDVEIRDLESANGTYVNAKRIAGAVPIQPGDDIRFGRTTYHVEAVAPPKAEAPATPSPSPPPPQPRGSGTDSMIVRLQRSVRRTRWIAAGAVLVAVAVAAAVPTVLLAGGGGGSSTLALEKATVLITAEDAGGNVIYSGSGSIVDRHGLILTNAHVGAPKAPGLAVQYDRSVTDIPAPARLVVWLFRGEDKTPTRTYVARPVAADGYADVAVLRIAQTVDGRTVDSRKLNLPTIPLGNSDRVHDGQSLTIVGYPGTGGATVNVARGTVSGFLPDDRMHTGRAWIKTDAQINAGNSGGVAADAQGRLVGIPSNCQPGEPSDRCEGNARSIDIARPILRRAERGETWQSPYLVAGTGRERFSFSAWSATKPDAECRGRKVDSFPSGTSTVWAVFGAEGMRRGEDVEIQRNGGDGFDPERFTWGEGATDGCYRVALMPDQDGSYDVQFFAGPSLRPVGNSPQVDVGGGG